MLKRQRSSATRVLSALVACALLAALAACDSHEIDDQFFVISMSFDAADDGQLVVSVLAPSGSKASDSGGDGAQNADGEKIRADVVMASVTAPTAMEAFDLFNLALPRGVNYMQLKEIIFAEELACRQDFNLLVADLVYSRRFRRAASVFVVAGRASKALKARTELQGVRITKSIEAANATLFQTKYVPKLTMMDLALLFSYGGRTPIAAYEALKTGQGAGENEATRGFMPGDFLPGYVPQINAQKSEIIGAAVFDHYHMVDRLTGYETQLVQLMMGMESYPLLAAEVEIGGRLRRVGVELRTDETRVRRDTDITQEPMKLTIGVQLTGVTGITMRDEERETLRQELERILKDDMLALVKRFQAGRTDVLGFFDSAVWRFYTRADMDSFDWQNKFMNADADVSVSLALLKGGIEPGSLPHPMR